MKRLTICALFGAATFISCQKNDPPVSTSNTGNMYVPVANSITATVDGVAFQNVSVECDYITPGYTSESAYYHNAQGEDYREVELFMADTLSPGTYTLQNFQNASMYVAYYDTATGFLSDSGMITVTVNDTVHKVMKGTFSAMLINTTPVTHQVQGSFVFNYQN